jgi:membrane-bound lytic murein transglycosylase F
MKQTLLNFCVVLLLTTGCQSTREGLDESLRSGQPIPTHMETSGKLVALIDNSISSYYIINGQPRGFEYELLRWFCKDHDLALELKIIPHFEHVLDSLVAGVGDIAAANLSVTKDRLERVHFTPYLMRNRQMLVQRFPENHRRLDRKALEKKLVTDALDLDGKTVHVHQGSSFYTRLQNFARENGIDIQIEHAPNDIDTDELIRMVADGEIDYTVTDENVGKLQSHLHNNLHIGTPLSLSQSISWATRKDSDSLNDLLEAWILKNRPGNKFAVIYRKYFHPTRTTIAGMQSAFNLSQGGKISYYDDHFRKHGDKHDIDWRLLAALAYQESRFNPEATSAFGARGLMQVVPNTAQRFGVAFEDIYVPERNIHAGSAFLKHLFEYWERKLEDHTDLNKFVLASYNAGLGHVIDARKLAEKYRLSSEKWEGNVAEMLLKKSNPRFYRDPVVKHGYCRGSEPVRYVENVLGYYTQYVMLTPGENQSNSKELSLNSGR